GEVLAPVRRYVRLDEVYLLAARVQPSPVETEVGPVGALGQAEGADVEVPGRGHVADVDRDMVESSRSHAPSLGHAPPRGPGTPGHAYRPAGRTASSRASASARTSCFLQNANRTWDCAASTLS